MADPPADPPAAPPALTPEDPAVTQRTYEHLLRALPDPRLIFMNHGYAPADAPPGAFAWVDPAREEDVAFRYSANLVRHLLAGVATAGARVLDVGCGRGGAAAYMARHAGAREVVGLDRLAGHVAFCRRVHAHPALAFVEGDAQQLPLPAARFDVVTNIESSHYYADLPRFFAEVRRVLVPGGTFCYTDCLPDGHAAARTAALTAAGFAVLSAEDITPDVARAILYGARDLIRLYVRMLDPARGNEAEVVAMIHELTLGKFFEYTFEPNTYHLWRLARP